MTLVPKAGAAALLASTVGEDEAEVPEAELEGGVEELVLFEGRPIGICVVVADAVAVVAVSEGVDVVFVALPKSKTETLPME